MSNSTIKYVLPFLANNANLHYHTFTDNSGAYFSLGVKPSTLMDCLDHFNERTRAHAYTFITGINYEGTTIAETIAGYKDSVKFSHSKIDKCLFNRMIELLTDETFIEWCGDHPPIKLDTNRIYKNSTPDNKPVQSLGMKTDSDVKQYCLNVVNEGNAVTIGKGNKAMKTVEDVNQYFEYLEGSV